MASLQRTPSRTIASLVVRRASLPLFLALLAVPAAAQSHRSWTFGAGVISDWARCSAPDGAGGFYIGGTTEGTLGGPGAGDDDAWLARYDGAGSLIWIRQLGSSDIDKVVAAAPDGTGGVYLGGGTWGTLGGPSAGDEDAWFAHYDGAGNQTWIVQLGTSTIDEALFVSPDGAGGVYLGGWTYGSLGGPNLGEKDAWLARYDASGNQVWTLQLGTSSPDGASASAPDGAGGVYVGGDTEGSLGGPNAGSSDAWLAHYDGAGNQLWIRQLGTTGADEVTIATVDGGTGLLVGGDTTGDLAGPNQGQWDAWVAHYDSAGSQIWIRQFGSSDDNTPFGAASDGNGGLYMGGWVGFWVGDAWLAHYDGAGNRSWIRVLQAGDSDNLSGAAPDGTGGVFVCGSTDGDLAAPNAGGMDAWVGRYDILGTQAWIRQFGESDREGILTAAPVGESGVFVGGMTDGGLGGAGAGRLDGWLGRHDNAGNQLWLLQLGTSAEDSLTASAPDDAGGVFVGGYTDGDLGGPSAGDRDGWLARYDGAGNQLWILQLGTGYDDSVDSAAPDGAGGVFVGGFTEGDLGGASAGLSDGWLARYDGAGNQLWLQQLGTLERDSLAAAAPDTDGGVYVGGETFGSLGAANAGDADGWLARYDGAGNPTWVRQLGTSARDTVAGAAARATLGVYVCGETYGSLGGTNYGGSDAWAACFDDAGNLRWTERVPSSSSESSAAAATISTGDVYCAGSTTSGGDADAYLVRYTNYVASATVRNGSGVNRPCFTSTTLPMRGSTWTAEIDTSGHPGAVATMLRAYFQPIPGLLTPYGEILVNLTPPAYFTSTAIPDGTGVGHHAVSIPASLSSLIIIQPVYAQGCILGGGAEFCNAIDLRCGS